MSAGRECGAGLGGDVFLLWTVAECFRGSRRRSLLSRAAFPVQIVKTSQPGQSIRVTLDVQPGLQLQTRSGQMIKSAIKAVSK
ncbi:MAG: hypothetical protein CMJ81_24145 [Planctomycetaceae bacterium]|nr:hypothetical protein [Planctomycetaceae bacterium]